MAMLAAALLLIAACAGGTQQEQDQTAAKVVSTLTTEPAAPYPGPFTATFDQAAFTTNYAVVVNLPSSAQFEAVSSKLTARWSGPNCGEHGVVDFVGSFKKGTDDWNFGYAQEAGTAGESISYRWVHPHPPCGETPDHTDATIKVIVSNKIGAFTCTYVGSASGKGDCRAGI